MLFRCKHRPCSLEKGCSMESTAQRREPRPKGISLREGISALINMCSLPLKRERRWCAVGAQNRCGSGAYPLPTAPPFEWGYLFLCSCLTAVHWVFGGGWGDQLLSLYFTHLQVTKRRTTGASSTPRDSISTSDSKPDMTLS